LFIFFSFPFAYVILFYYAPSQPLKQLPNPELNIRQNRNSRAGDPAVACKAYVAEQCIRLCMVGCVSGCVSLEKAYKGFIFEINLL
jgi:hypothetical protein